MILLLKKIVGILLLALKRFYREKRILWATSLTLTTVFSLVPLLSVLFFLFNFFGDLSELKALIQPYIYKTLVPGAQEKVINTINILVNNINFSTIGALGSTVLIISVFLLLFEIEYALNEIWFIKHHLSIISRAAIYWTTLTIGPLVLAVSLFIVVTVQSFQAVKVFDTFIHYDIFSNLSYILIWLAFSGIYYLMPGTNIKLTSALFGGIIAGTIWKISGAGFSLYTSKFLFYYPKIYGSLAAIPLFLLWLFLCWILFLLGAEITYFHQNYAFYKTNAINTRPSAKDKKDLTLLILLYIAKRFEDGRPATLLALSEVLKLPIHLVFELISSLRDHGFIIESSDQKKCFVPARSLESIKLSEILNKVDETALHPNHLLIHCDDSTCRSILKLISTKSAPTNLDKSLKDLLREHSNAV